MASLRKWLDRELKGGEVIEAIVFGKFGWGYDDEDN